MSTFRLAQIFSSTAWNANETHGVTEKFPEKPDNIWRYSTFSIATD